MAENNIIKKIKNIAVHYLFVLMCCDIMLQLIEIVVDHDYFQKEPRLFANQ